MTTENKPKAPETAVTIRNNSYSQGDEFVRSLVDLRNRGAIVLTPVTFVQQPPQQYNYGYTVVQISLEMRAKEVYHDPRWKDGELALTHKGLARLWNAAGGEWEWTARQDDGKHPFIAEILAKGRIKDLQNEYHSAVKRARLDYRDGQPQVEGWSPKQIMEARRKITERAESMAQNRVIRELLNVRDSYHRDELASPFVLAKAVYAPDLSDPFIKRAYTEHGLHGTAALYGRGGYNPDDDGPPAAKSLQYSTATPSDRLDDADLDPPNEEPAASEPAGEPAIGGGGALLQGAMMQARQTPPDLAWTLANVKQQVDALNHLIIRKGYDVARLDRPLSAYDPAQREKFYHHLQSMPDANVDGTK